MKIVAGVLSALVVVVAVLVGFLFIKEPARRPASTERVEITEARVARGQYLVQSVLGCWDCHSERDWTRWGGPVVAGTEGGPGPCFTRAAHGFPGDVCPPNITPHPSGIGEFSDGQLIRAVREGIAQDERALFGMMYYTEYRALSDEDIRSVVAYLRRLPPLDQKAPPIDLDLWVKLAIKFSPQPVEGEVVAPPAGETVEYGKYLTTIARCRDCHTDDGGEDFAGGQRLVGHWGTSISANITSDPETGIGWMNKEQFILRFKAFADPQTHFPVEAGKNTAMPWLTLSGMSEQDLGAVHRYLQTVKPVKNRVIPAQ